MNILMPREDIDACLTILEQHRPKLVLEWGCGGSTVRFSQFSTVERWHCIEHDLKWVEAVSGQTSTKVVVHHASIDSEE